MNPQQPPGPYPPQGQPGTTGPPDPNNPQPGQAVHTLYSQPYSPPYGQPQSPEQTPGSTAAPGGSLVQQPEIYNSPSLAAVPYGAQPAPQPQTAAGSAPAATQYPAKKGPNKLVIIVIAGVALLLVLVVIAVVVSSGKPSDDQANQAQQIDPSQLQSLQPAQSIDLEQANNAISQDLSSLDDEKDFPTDSLDDKTLGL